MRARVAIGFAAGAALVFLAGNAAGQGLSAGGAEVAPEHGFSGATAWSPERDESAAGQVVVDTARYTGPPLPASHWAVEAARRVDALLLADDYLPAQRVVPLEVVERILREAAARAPTDAPRLAPIISAWHARLLAEFPRLTASQRPQPVAPDGRIAAGYRDRGGATGPGTGEIEPHRTGAIPLPDRSEMLGEASAAVAAGASVGMGASFGMDAGSIRTRTAYLSLASEGWRFDAGRVPVGYAYGLAGGVLLTGDAPLDAVQLQTARPVRLPGFLAHLGPFAFHGFFGRMREDRHPDEPMIWGMSGQFRPHPRVIFGVNRAAMFGGDQAVTFDRVMSMLIGRVAGIGFENQIVSVSGRVILPTESVVPLEAHVEWGAEDAAGGWWDVPGQVFGLWSPSLPGIPGLSAGVEVTRLATSCCGNPSWYRHWSFNGSWASGDRPLGHPLGGDGNEVKVLASLDLVDSRIKVYGEGFRRERRSENLYSPGRAGRSTGAEGGAIWFLASRFRMALEGSFERGDHWTERQLRLQGEVTF